MLVIKRRSGESFFVNHYIKITILGPCSSVRIGINAPSDCEIWREEVLPVGNETAKRLLNTADSRAAEKRLIKG